MANLIRHTAVWTGSPGLPGYTQFHQEVIGDIPTQAQQGHYSVHDFFEALESLIPDEIEVKVDPIYQIVDVASGEITGEATVTTASVASVGAYVSDWQRQVGVLVEWHTGTFIGSRRLRGRTYLVPLGGTAATDGTLPDGTIATIVAANASILDNSRHFVVWHRPVAGAGGQLSSITSAIVRDKAALLRSRMD